ncbi:YciI family protein [Actinacidiphila sp. bgisy160]|uniref:YciI family protein n=1 Tax=Actinacidiphila sp. bgisy160 TaxID=3413796 RepID=UPI003D754AE7
MLYLLFLTYAGPEEDAGPFVAAHVAFLERHHRAGTFLLSGQTVPSSEGGVILARGTDRRTVERIAAEDPLVTSGVATYTVTTVDPARMHPVLAGLLGGA